MSTDFDGPRIERAVREILLAIGEDPERDGLRDTPARVARAFTEQFSGLGQRPEDVLTTVFDADHDELVLVRDISFNSMCEHHLLPFFGTMHVAYLPKDKVIGLSKIPRIVDMFARRLQLQERLTQEVATTIQEVVEPRGVGVICEARHFCMMMRGVEKQHSGTVTSAMLGAFREGKETRDEFLSLVSHKNHPFY